jgi:hypothetical protein
MALNDAPLTIAALQQRPLRESNLAVVTPESIAQSPLRSNQILLGNQQLLRGRLEIDEKARKARLQRNLDNKMPRDATSMDYQVLDGYNSQVGGELPMVADADGRQVYDMTSIKNLMANKNALAFEAAGGFGSDKLTPFQGAALDSLAKSGNLAYAFDQSTGKLKDSQGLAEALQMGPRVSPEDSIKLQDNINELETNKQTFARIRELTQKEGVVGPLAGGKGGRLWAWVKAVGGDSERFTDQREVEIFGNEKALKAAEAMKGALSDNDIKFLKDSLAKLTDSPELWDSFLDKLEAKNDEALSNRLNGLYFPEGATEAVPVASAGARGVTGTPAAAAMGGVDYSSYDQLPPRSSNVPNSTILRGTLGWKNGPGITLPSGKFYNIPDNLYRWVQDNQRQAAAPAPAPAPAAAAVAVEDGDLSAVAVSEDPATSGTRRRRPTASFSGKL